MMRAFGAELVIASILVLVAGSAPPAAAPPATTKGTPASAKAAPAGSAASLPTVDEILDRYVAAIGGRDKLKAVRSMRMRGTMSASPGFTATYLLEMKRPSSVRTELTYNGAAVVQASDGTQGWALMPAPGKAPAPVPMTPQQMHDLRQQADIEGPLVDARAKGHAIELVGKESAGSSMAWNVKLTDEAGVVRNFFLDAQTYLPVKEIVHRTVEGKEVEAEMRSSDYREVSGLKFPYLLESSANNLAGSQRLVLDTIEINPALGPERFQMPATVATPPAKSADPRKPAAPKP